jgi:beta-lactamase regulating signal transducer with metallopeptidase domain
VENRISESISLNDEPSPNATLGGRAPNGAFGQMEDNTFHNIASIILMAYPTVSLFVFLFFAFSYAHYSRKLKASLTEAGSDEIDELAKLSNGKAHRIYRSSLVCAPMLMGVFRPAVILPDIKHSEEQLGSVLMLELVHMRSHDIAVKWLGIIACSLHWLNPIVWLARREMDRICELACDEAVIRCLDENGRQSYLDALMSVASAKSGNAILCATMCSEKRVLKERLDAIVKYKKSTRVAIAISALMVAASLAAVSALGAGSSEKLIDGSSLKVGEVFTRNDVGGINADEGINPNVTLFDVWIYSKPVSHMMKQLKDSYQSTARCYPTCLMSMSWL